MEYVYGVKRNYIARYRVVKETDKSIHFDKFGKIIKVMKSSFGKNINKNGFNPEWLKQPDSKLDEEYRIQEKKSAFICKWQSLEDCNDERVWDIILAIDLK